MSLFNMSRGYGENMSRKASSKKSKTHKRKKHAIDHEWLREEFDKCYLEKGHSIPTIAKRYVRLKKSSTVGSIQGVLYEMRKKHLAEQAVADLVADEGGVVLTADPPYVVKGEAGKGKTFENPDYKGFFPNQPNLVYERRYERPSDLPKHYQVRADTPTVKSLQQKADYHLSQYKKALKEILEVIGGEQ